MVPVEFQLVSFWTVENQSGESVLKIRSEIEDPKGKILQNFEKDFSIKKGVMRFRNRTNIQGMPITEAGRYIIRMMQKKEGKKEFETIAELPVDIKISYKIMDKPVIKK